jgi:hypothetical protein
MNPKVKEMLQYENFLCYQKSLNELEAYVTNTKGGIAKIDCLKNTKPM